MSGLKGFFETDRVSPAGGRLFIDLENDRCMLEYRSYYKVFFNRRVCTSDPISPFMFSDHEIILKD